MLENIKPGQKITCTLVKAPKAEASRKTILRLMRRDPDVVRGLRKSQNVRRRTTVVYNRGNRDWVQRQTCGKIVRLTPGHSWSFFFDPAITGDLKSVGDYLKISA
jgi:hypothetical protein